MEKITKKNRVLLTLFLGKQTLGIISASSLLSAV